MCARAGERTWQARYAYDFAKVGVPGLTAGVVYLRGSNIDTIVSNVRADGGTECQLHNETMTVTTLREV